MIFQEQKYPQRFFNTFPKHFFILSHFYDNILFSTPYMFQKYNSMYKTVNESSPGLFLLHIGVICGKIWIKSHNEEADRNLSGRD